MKVLLVDEEFGAYGGHHAAYDLPILEELERRGVPCCLVADKTLSLDAMRFEIVPAFNTRAALAVRLPSGPRLFTQVVSSVAGNLITGWDLLRRVNAHVAAGDVILLCRPLSRTRVAYGLWLWWLTSNARAVTVIYVIHNESEARFKHQMRFLRRLARGHRLEFVAHSPAIVQQIGRSLGIHPRVVALPFKPAAFVARPSTHDRPIRFAFLGLGHYSKGFDLVLNAIDLSSDLIKANELEFTIQCYLPFRDRLSERLLRDAKALSLKVGGIDLIDHELSPTNYLLELQRADIVLIPHRPATYRWALSGVFADAMGAGRPVIVAEGTYMSEIVGKTGAGVSFESGNAVSLQHSIVGAAAEVDQLLRSAREARGQWLQEQGPEAFVSDLLQLCGAARPNPRD